MAGMSPSARPVAQLPDFVVDHLPAARRSLRVACVTETWPPEVNGVSVTLARIVEGLQQRGHALQLVRPRQGRDAAATADAPPMAPLHEVLMRGLPVPRYPDLRMGVPSKRALVRLWSAQRPDVVHIATEGPLGWSALQAARHLKLPLASDFRTNFHAYSRHYGVGWLHKPIMAYLRKFHNHTQCTMVPTDALRRELATLGFQRLVVVARGVDTQRFAPQHRDAALRASWGVGPEDLVICCVGRLAPEKNLSLLLQGYQALLQRQPRARLVLVGSGPMEAELRARCPQAIFAGQRSGHDLAAHYASADLFAFASLTETFGNVTTEALASGLPVLAFDHAAAGQLVRTGHNGLLAPYANGHGDAQAWLAGLLALAEDGPGRAAMAQAARQGAAQLGWDGIVARFEHALVSAMGQARLPAWSTAGGASRVMI